MYTISDRKTKIYTTDMTSQSLNINPHNISPNRTRSPLNISDYCVENRSGSCSEVENTSISANPTTSNSTNIILATSFHNRARLTLTNSSHCIENYAGSHLENKVTATYKTTPSKPTRRSFRQLRRSFRQLLFKESQVPTAI